MNAWAPVRVSRGAAAEALRRMRISSDSVLMSSGGGSFLREDILPEGAMDRDQNPAGPWNPGVQSQIPRELLPLCTIFRPENVLTSIASAEELHAMTGFDSSELVVFRPQRLALHELLIRVTADFEAPAGLQIGDLGINFRRIAGQILTHYLDPEMDLIIEAFERAGS